MGVSIHQEILRLDVPMANPGRKLGESGIISASKEILEGDCCVEKDLLEARHRREVTDQPNTLDLSSS